MKKLTFNKIIFICFLMLFLNSCDNKNFVVNQKPKYTVMMSNWFRCKVYKCESFEVKGDTYFLYNKNKELIAVVKVPKGYAMEVIEK